MKGSHTLPAAALILMLTACGYWPHGRWIVTEREAVLVKKYDPVTVAFYLEPGDICALSDHWHVKDMGYKEVSCEKGKGYITSDENFKKLSD